MALHLKLKPHSHPSLRLLSSSSSSSSSSSPLPPPPPHSDEAPPDSQSQSQSHPSVSSYFSDIKQRLGSPPSAPRRIPTDPPPPTSLFPPQSQNSPASLDEIRKRLAAFRVRSPSTGSTPSSSSSSPPPRFQELFKNNLQNNPPGSAPAPSFDAIRQNLQQTRSRDAFFSLRSLQERIRSQEPPPGAQCAPSLIGSDGPLPESVFGREARERKAKEGEEESKGLKTQFLKAYTHQELGEKLVKLRPEGGEKKKEGFSLKELNQRLVKLRKMEEEAPKLMDCPFTVLRESLHNIQNSEESRKSLCLFHFFTC